MDDMKEQLQKLRKDVRLAANTLSAQEARYLVDSYYIMQEDRKRAHNQVRALDESEEPHEIIDWLARNSQLLENELKKVLDDYANAHKIGIWMNSITGIGPVISAGFLAHIDIEKSPTVGHMWRFAGLDPTSVWEKGQKRPWNAQLKTLCWKAGQSFMKLSNNPKCLYGTLYKDRKAYEVRRNESGGNRERAAQILLEKNFNKSTDAYKHLTSGILPPAQIDARARRWAVKMYLSHLQTVWWFDKFGAPPPVPYVIGIMGHIDYIEPPNMEMYPGLAEALRAQRVGAP